MGMWSGRLDHWHFASILARQRLANFSLFFVSSCTSAHEPDIILTMQHIHEKHRGNDKKVVRGAEVALCKYTIISDILKSKWVFSERQAKPDSKSKRLFSGATKEKEFATDDSIGNIR